jgi:hypothetical protein
MIPQILHFIWIGLGDRFPELYKTTLKTAVKNTGLRVVLHTDDPTLVFEGVETRGRIFTTEYNGHVFDSTNDKVSHLKDIVRLEILYQEGGIYSDLDVFWLKNPWHLLHHQCFIGFDNKAYKILCNAVIGSEPGNAAIEQYKDWSIKNYPPKKYWLLANPYKLWKDRTDVVFLERKEFFPVRWTKMANVTLEDVKESSALHLYKSFGLVIGGEFFTHLYGYLDAPKN